MQLLQTPMLAQSPDVQPGTPVTPPTPPVIVTVGPDGKPITIALPKSEAELEELIAQREELSDQLTAVASRRRELAREITATTEPGIRAGLESRLAILDQRIVQLETDLATTGRQLSSAPAELVARAQNREVPGRNDEGFEEGFFVGGFSALGLAIVAGFFLRRRWRRQRPAQRGEVGADTSPRLERLEHGMDAIAVEIERISEGQRFVTRLLSESQASAGQPQRLAKHAVDDPATR